MIECLDAISDDDALVEQSGEPAENGLIVRRIAGHPQNCVGAGASGSIRRLFFPPLLDMEALVTVVAPGSRTDLHRHSYEALFYVIAGAGHTSIMLTGNSQRIAWRAGDLFVTPQRWWHQHVNEDSLHRACLLEVTTSPLMKAMGTHSIDVREGDLHS